MKFHTIIALVILVITSCNLPSIDNLPLTGEYAIPLINSEIKINSLLEDNENFQVEVGSDGLLTLKYKVSLLSESLEEILPSISSIGEVAIPDTVSFFPLSTSDNFVINKALLIGDQMRFRFSHDKNETVNIHMTIPELTREGAVFEFYYELVAEGELPFTEFTESFDLEGYKFESEKNELTFRYDARNPEGERIKLVFAAMSFNQLRFSYGEGNFERTSYDLEGDSLVINVLDGWQEGKVAFEEPKINFNISHSYGFPIAFKINEVEINTIDGDKKFLEGELVGNELDLAYPNLDQVGQIVKTNISLDKNNSNINTLFDERISFLDYDIDAIINPENDAAITGFASDKSVLEVDSEMELPLLLHLEQLRLQDTIDIEKLFANDLSEAEFKVVTQNTYPLRVVMYFIFLDENENVLERFLENDPLVIEPAQEKTRFVNLDSELINRIRETRKIVVVPQFTTVGMDSDFVSLLSDQKLELRVGLKFKL